MWHRSTTQSDESKNCNPSPPLLPSALPGRRTSQSRKWAPFPLTRTQVQSPYRLSKTSPSNRRNDPSIRAACLANVALRGCSALTVTTCPALPLALTTRGSV
jgi:hypothetical protein